MHIHAAEARNGQNARRQQQTVGNNHDEIGRQSAQRGLRLFGLEGGRLKDWQAEVDGQLLHGTQANCAASARGPVRLGQYRDGTVAEIHQALKSRDGESGRPGEDDPPVQMTGARSRVEPDGDELAGPSWRRAFAAFFFRRCRFSSDR